MLGWLKQAVAGAALALGVAMAPQAAQAQFFGGWGYQTFRSGIDAELRLLRRQHCARPD